MMWLTGIGKAGRSFHVSPPSSENTAPRLKIYLCGSKKRFDTPSSRLGLRGSTTMEDSERGSFIAASVTLMLKRGKIPVETKPGMALLPSVTPQPLRGGSRETCNERHGTERLSVRTEVPRPCEQSMREAS